ncbi:RNA-directed DNA polymerase (Reverse transcriptase), Ribonuclease H [Gossypium australe]|uniref:RNA-directed DNA polymerase (Reverse transcriptase), Ribonuclease H n=1 Tax=Gossypium australe TaxID=47621 RepID=A0A5B6WNU6_9ROSI|nr:RNA-directed DNA polymerase (Reverse transcriptase), Ribonuclease H [Gossypium australe]
MGLLKYMLELTALNGRMARALEDYKPLNFDFPNKVLMYVAAIEEGAPGEYPWKLNFDEASNAMGNRIEVVLLSPDGDHYPFTSKHDFDCTNNMAEYERGEHETRDPKLINYQRLVLELIKKFDDITFCCLPEDEN